MKVILASASPRRKELIKKIDGLEVEIVPSTAKEFSTKTAPNEYVKDLARLKAVDVYEKTGGCVIGADTVVVIDDKILGKPKTADEARETLKTLSGRTHEVITGLCLVSEKGVLTDSATSYVTFKPYDKDFIDGYISTGSPFDKAGGYGIQDESFVSYVERYDGELDNIIGLPVEKLKSIISFFDK